MGQGGADTRAPVTVQAWHPNQYPCLSAGRVGTGICEYIVGMYRVSLPKELDIPISTHLGMHTVLDFTHQAAVRYRSRYVKSYDLRFTIRFYDSRFHNPRPILRRITILTTLFPTKPRSRALS
ncbi:hypothetical protein CRG98_043653 [Punica granatum]|uniref:Uncharacterized protein n=1 Tax=Punica granatum TaxID=22663 RepID=A0A2I0HW98_PUNGR|nr:hypothetical protein CRG98_043653 [Punica granatum]